MQDVNEKLISFLVGFPICEMLKDGHHTKVASGL